jgi:hypothetical protein
MSALTLKADIERRLSHVGFVPIADITSTQFLIDTKIKGSSNTAGHYLFSPSEPESDPGVRVEPGSVVEGEEGAGCGAVNGADDPMLGIGGRVGGVIAGGATGCGAAGFADAAALGADIFGFVVSCGFVFFAAVFSFAHALILFIIPFTPFPFFRAVAFFLIFFAFFFVFFAFLVMIALPIFTAPYRYCPFRKPHPRTRMRFLVRARDRCKAAGR